MTTPDPTQFPYGINSDTDLIKSGVVVGNLSELGDLNESVAAANNAAASAVSTSESTQQALAGVTADANAAKVMLTAAINGYAPLNYKGYWDAATNTPTLSTGSGTDGDLYIVSVAGDTTLDGNSAWSIGDGAWFTGGKWQYFARAGWAAVGQSITALTSIYAGQSSIRTPGSDKWATAWLDSIGGIIGGLLRDGSPQFPGTEAILGPTTVKTSTLSGTGIVTLDEIGAVVINQSTLSFGGIIDEDTRVLASNVTGRVPGNNDDSTVGYKVGDVWQHDGTLYECLYDTPSCAVWDWSQGAAACPSDLLGDDIIGAWGIDAQLSGYVGSGFDVTSTINGATVVTTISILQSGYHDINALNKVLALRDSGTMAEITKLYDQSGNGFHLTGVYGSAPKIGEVRVGQSPAISFDTTGASSARTLSNTAITVDNGTFSAFAFGRYAGTNSAYVTGTSHNEHIGLLTLGSGSTQISTISGINEDGKLGLYDGTSFYEGTQYQPCNPHVLSVSAAGGAEVTVSIGETTNVITVPSTALSNPLNGFTLGALSGQNASNGIIVGAALSKGAVSTSDLANINRSAILKWDWFPQVKPKLWVCGDSRSAGYLNSDGKNWATILPDYLFEPMQVFNLGVSGSETFDFLPNTLPGLQTEIASGGYNLAVIWLGINDFAQGKSKPDVMQNLQNAVTTLLRAGARHVWVISEVWVSDQQWFYQYFPVGQNPSVTVLYPFGQDTPLGQHKSGLFHPDNIHPLPAADRTLASIIADSINAFIKQEFSA